MLASPKLQRIILSSINSLSFNIKSLALSIERAAPTALGIWLEIVLVCGGIFNSLLPNTLCRPSLIGSSEDAVNDNARS